MVKRHLAIGLAAGMLIGGVTIGGLAVGARPGGEAASEVLDTSRKELHEARKSGQSLEEIAESKGLTMDEFKAQMESKMREKLTQKGLSEEDIDEKISQMKQMRGVKEDVREVSQELLGTSDGELKRDKESFKSAITEKGYANIEEFKEAVTEQLTEKWSAEGLSEEDIEERLESLENRKGRRGGRGFSKGEGYSHDSEPDASEVNATQS